MARHPPDAEIRRGSLPGHTQLPSFSLFLSGIEQGHFARNEILRSPSSRSDPLEDPRHSVTAHYSRFPERHPPLTGSPHRIPPAPSHYADVRPGGSVETQTPPDWYREDRAHPSTTLLQTTAQEGLPYAGHESSYAQGHGPSNNRVVVSEANIEGKGPCYIFDDGTVCQKTINGDMVNPKWGTTKAGKPRKRLGQACNTCREKKIRCDPQLPKCAQCQKFGRDCKFESNSRSSKGSLHKDSISSRESQSEIRHERTGSSTSAEALTDRTYSRANSRGSMNVAHLLSPSSTVDVSPSTEQPPSKRQRRSTSKHDADSPTQATDPSPVARKERSDSSHFNKCFAYDVDPFDVNPRLTRDYAKAYLSIADSYVCSLFPAPQFLHWVQNCRSKSPGEMMLLYAILATAMAFSPTKHEATFQYQFKNIAKVALVREHGCNLQRVRTQLLLAMVEYADGQFEESKEYAISAIKLAYDMGLHEEVSVDKPMFGLNLAAHLESRRRTFWLAFTSMSFYTGLFGSDSRLQTLTCNLRLPCDDELFRKDNNPELPVLQYESGSVTEFPYSKECGAQAFLLEVVIIANEAIGWLNTGKRHLSRREYLLEYDQMYHDTSRRLSIWDDRIKTHYKLRNSQTTGLHMLYHFVLMTINRHAHHNYLSHDQIHRNARNARTHAIQLLELIHTLQESPSTATPMSYIALECPMAGHTIYLAIDIITAAGTMRSLLEHQSRNLSFIEMVSAGLSALEALGKHWKTALTQLKEVKTRVTSVMNHTTAGTSSRKAAFFVRTPLVGSYGLEDDVVYGVERVRYLQALGLGDVVRGNEDICEMGTGTGTGTT